MGFIVEVYAEGAALPADCLPDFYATRAEAETHGAREVARVAAIPWLARDPTIDWAVRFTVEPASAD